MRLVRRAVEERQERLGTFSEFPLLVNRRWQGRCDALVVRLKGAGNAALVSDVFAIEFDSAIHHGDPMKFRPTFEAARHHQRQQDMRKTSLWAMLDLPLLRLRSF
jgi:hypothetical protein